MIQAEVIQILKKVGAMVTNSHVVYTSGRHGTAYINKDALYPHTEDTSYLCRALAENFLDHNVEIVIAPAVGAIILSQWVAHHLTSLSGKEVFAVYADKENGDFTIKRGYDKFVTGKRVLVIEDILTTGSSVRKVVKETKKIGGNIVGLGALCNRGGVTPKDVGYVPELYPLMRTKLDTWDEAECMRNGPCAQGIPINTDVGKGKEFLEWKQH